MFAANSRNVKAHSTASSGRVRASSAEVACTLVPATATRAEVARHARFGQSERVHGTSTGEARQLTDRERELVAAMLSCLAEPEARLLHAQLETALVRPGCPCGCGSIDFVLQASSTGVCARGGAGVVVEGEVLDEHGQALGGLMLFLDSGLLHDLEVWSVSDPIELPPVERVRLRPAANAV